MQQQRTVALDETSSGQDQEYTPIMQTDWSVPVRIVSSPTGNWWTSPVFTLVLGLILGIFVEPLKAGILGFVERRRVRAALYDELGAYLARVEEFKINLFRHKQDGPILGSNYFLWSEITRPTMPNFDYYNEKEMGVLLRTDKTQGIRRIVARLRAFGMQYRPDDITPAPRADKAIGAEFVQDVVDSYDAFLKPQDLDRRSLIKAYERHRVTEAKTSNAPSLFTREGVADDPDVENKGLRS
jgi:hypothetical protein